MLAARAREVLRVDVRQLLGTGPQPVLSVAFADDGVVPRRYSEEVVDHHHNGRLVLLPGGHLAMFEDPHSLAREVVQFVQGCRV